MPLNSGRPIMGRFASDGLGFLSSTAGFAVAGSIGVLSQTTTPQMPAPHLLTRTLASPACVSQIPLTSPPDCARAGEMPAIANAARTRPKPQVINFKDENWEVMNLVTAIWETPDCFRGQTRLATKRTRANGATRQSPGQAAEVNDAGLRRASPQVVGVGRHRLEPDAALFRLFGVDFALERFPAPRHVERHVVRFAKQQRKRSRALVLERLDGG